MAVPWMRRLQPRAIPGSWRPTVAPIWQQATSVFRRELVLSARRLPHRTRPLAGLHHTSACPTLFRSLWDSFVVSAHGPIGFTTRKSRLAFGPPSMMDSDRLTITLSLTLHSSRWTAK
jgi:hypothetical protein